MSQPPILAAQRGRSQHSGKKARKGDDSTADAAAGPDEEEVPLCLPHLLDANELRHLRKLVLQAGGRGVLRGQLDILRDLSHR